MARVNVYLPDELAAAAKAAGLNVSSVTQEALRAALAARRINEWLDGLVNLQLTGVTHKVALAAVNASKDEFERGV